MSGDAHGHGHGPPYTVPDYKIYKVEDVPLLMTTKKALESQGLRDPWLRNEVWRYSPKHFGTEKSKAKQVFLRGFGYGLAATVLTVVGTAVYDRTFPPEHGHEHEDHQE